MENGESEVSPQHIEGAVSKIDDLQHAEYERQAGRDEEEQHAYDETTRHLRDDAGGRSETAHKRGEIHDEPGAR